MKLGMTTCSTKYLWGAATEYLSISLVQYHSPSPARIPKSGGFFHVASFSHKRPYPIRRSASVSPAIRCSHACGPRNGVSMSASLQIDQERPRMRGKSASICRQIVTQPGEVVRRVHIEPGGEGGHLQPLLRGAPKRLAQHCRAAPRDGIGG